MTWRRQLIISECITINRLILKNMQLRKILVLAGLSRTSNNIRIQHPPSTYRTCVFQMRNLCWKPQTTMLQKFPIWLDMKIHYISAASSGNSLALRRHSFGNNCGKMKRIRWLNQKRNDLYTKAQVQKLPGLLIDLFLLLIFYFLVTRYIYGIFHITDFIFISSCSINKFLILLF